jgi:hypothetical protein
MFKKIFIAALFVAAAISTSAAPALAAQSSPAGSMTSSSTARAAQGQVSQVANVECATQFCDFIDPSFVGTCYATSTSQSSLAGCRDVGRSVANDSGSTVRLYFSPSFGGAHVCINPHTEFSSISRFSFNSGSGLAGFGQTIINNVASMSIGGSACTNPL